MKVQEVNFKEFPSRPIRGKLSKNIGFSHNLHLKNQLENKNLTIDKNLSIVSKQKRKDIKIFEDFLKDSRNKQNISGTYFLYRYNNPIKHYFEAEDSIRMFIRAVRIYKKTKCDVKAFFPINEKKYFRIHDLFDSIEDDDYSSDSFSYISSTKELNQIKKIYSNLGKANINEQFGSFSKIHNAVQFYEYFYQQKWILQKTALAFTALESLFSDSSKNEITYKIALRVSYFLYPKDRAKRKETFDFIKEGYEIRSYFVHGSDVQKRIDKIMRGIEKRRQLGSYSFYSDFIEELEYLLSSCLAKILLDNKNFDFFSKKSPKPEEEKEFYDNLVLS